MGRKKKRKGGARDDTFVHINYTRKQLENHLKRVETKLLLIEERRRNQEEHKEQTRWRT